MGRISDIIPLAYYGGQNDLIRFTDCLDVEVKELERKIKGITDLVSIDKCPDDKLPYLAALTNCPLMGNDPALWRRQILNWPYILRIKGTERSLDVFLNSIDVDEHKLYTFFRDAEGNLVVDKPEGAPFIDSSGLWHNIRTHYFDLDILYHNEHFLTWSEWHSDFLRSMNIWLTRAKPFHSELRNLRVILQREEKQDLFVGTATGQATSHDIAFVPKTEGTGNMPLTVGTGTLQSQRHSIAIILRTQGTAGLEVAVGTGTAQGTRHYVAFIPKTKGTGCMSLTVGAGTSQAQHHYIPIVQHTQGTAKHYISVGTATAKGTQHDIPLKQDTSGTSGLEVSVATCAFQRHTHNLNIKQSTHGTARQGLSVGGAVACGIQIHIKMAA